MSTLREVKAQVIAVFDRWHGIGVPDTAGELGGVMEVVQPALDERDVEIVRLRGELTDARNELVGQDREIYRLGEQMEAKDAEIARLRERWESSQLHVHEQIDRAEKAEAANERVQIALALMRHGLTGDERSLGKLSAIETIEDALADPDDVAALDEPVQQQEEANP